MELFNSLSAGWSTTLLRLKLPAAVPFLIPALRLGAAASVVGAIVAETSIGVPGGIGRVIIDYSQQATGDPSRLYAAVIGAALLGLIAAGLISLLDLGLRSYQRGRRHERHRRADRRALAGVSKVVLPRGRVT